MGCLILIYVSILHQNYNNPIETPRNALDWSYGFSAILGNKRAYRGLCGHPMGQVGQGKSSHFGLPCVTHNTTQNKLFFNPMKNHKNTTKTRGKIPIGVFDAISEAQVAPLYV